MTKPFDGISEDTKAAGLAGIHALTAMSVEDRVAVLEDLLNTVSLPPSLYGSGTRAVANKFGFPHMPSIVSLLMIVTTEELIREPTESEISQSTWANELGSRSSTLVWIFNWIRERKEQAMQWRVSAELIHNTPRVLYDLQPSIDIKILEKSGHYAAVKLVTLALETYASNDRMEISLVPSQIDALISDLSHAKRKLGESPEMISTIKERHQESHG